MNSIVIIKRAGCILAYIILLAMDELHMLGQHWQMAQAAEPKQLKKRNFVSGYF